MKVGSKLQKCPDSAKPPRSISPTNKRQSLHSSSMTQIGLFNYLCRLHIIPSAFNWIASPTAAGKIAKVVCALLLVPPRARTVVAGQAWIFQGLPQMCTMRQGWQKKGPSGASPRSAPNWGNTPPWLFCSRTHTASSLFFCDRWEKAAAAEFIVVLCHGWMQNWRTTTLVCRLLFSRYRERGALFFAWLVQLHHFNYLVKSCSKQTHAVREWARRSRQCRPATWWAWKQPLDAIFMVTRMAL